MLLCIYHITVCICVHNAATLRFSYVKTPWSFVPSTNCGNGSLYRWDPEKSSRDKFVALGLGTAAEYSFSTLSLTLLGMEQPYQFQSYDDENPSNGAWGSSIEDAPAESSEMPRSYHRENIIYGDLYNWFSSTAESGKASMVNTTVDDSVCPSGWKLPADNGGNDENDQPYKSFKNLFDSYALVNDESSSIIARSKTLSLVFGGYYSSRVYNEGIQGRYWSATAAGSSTLARRVHMTRSLLDPQERNIKTNGFSVRCVMRGSET